MAPERVTITVRSSAGEDAPLAVGDAMRQILDFFELLAAAGGEEAGLISWQLVDISMNSPITATAEAASTMPGISAEPIARREKAKVTHSFDEIKRERVPDWMDKSARERVKSLFARNVSGVGRTVVRLYPEEPPIVISPVAARAAVEVLNRFEAERPKPADDFSRFEIGSFEGNVIGLTHHYGRAAVEVRDRLSGAAIKCPLSDELRERIGKEHQWEEVWSNQRVLISGKLSFRVDGRIQGAEVHDIESINPPRLSFEEIADPGFTGGLAPSEYLDALREDDVG